jgi:hypothetical protein
VIERFIECGDRHHGFARIRCDACGHDYLLAFSCKTCYFCPSPSRGCCARYHCGPNLVKTASAGEHQTIYMNCNP